MAYYDFSNQRKKQKKSHRLQISLVLVAAALATALWLKPHSKLPNVAHVKIKPIQRIKALPLPAAPVVAMAPKLIEKPVAPKLEFYQLLKSSEPVVTAPRSHQYNLQVAALASPAAAQHMIHTLKKQAFSAHIVSTSNGSKTRWNRVMMGPYKTAQAARAMQHQLEHSGQKGVLLISAPH